MHFFLHLSSSFSFPKNHSFFLAKSLVLHNQTFSLSISQQWNIFFCWSVAQWFARSIAIVSSNIFEQLMTGISIERERKKRIVFFFVCHISSQSHKVLCIEMLVVFSTLNGDYSFLNWMLFVHYVSQYTVCDRYILRCLLVEKSIDHNNCCDVRCILVVCARAFAHTSLCIFFRKAKEIT